MIKQEHRHRATRRRQRVRLKKILFCFIFFLPPQSNNRENLTTGGRPTAESVRRVSELHAKIHLFFSSLPSFLYLVIEPARSRSNKRHIFFRFEHLSLVFLFLNAFYTASYSRITSVADNDAINTCFTFGERCQRGNYAEETATDASIGCGEANQKDPLQWSYVRVHLMNCQCKSSPK